MHTGLFLYAKQLEVCKRGLKDFFFFKYVISVAKEAWS